MNKKILIILILTISITACSSVLEVNVEINNIEAGVVEGSGQFERNSIVTLNAKANKGYDFNFWEEDSKRISDENPLVFALEKRRNLKANFKLEKYTINVSSSDNTKGIVFGSGEYKFKDKVLVEAKALEGFKFCGWEGINSDEKVVEFNAENDLRAIAYFTQEETKLIEKKTFKPIVSKDNNLLAYKFDNILSIYSLKEDKTLADFALFSEDINEKEISTKWSYDNNKIIINYLDEIIIQGINEDKMILDSGKINHFDISENKLGIFKLSNVENGSNVDLEIYNLDTLESINKFSFNRNNDFNRYTYAFNLVRDKLLYINKKTLHQVDIANNKISNLREFDKEIKRVFNINQDIIGLEFDKELMLINLDNDQEVIMSDYKPNEYYYLEDYKIWESSVLLKFKSNDKFSFIEVNFDRFNNITKQKIYGLMDGEVIGFVKLDETYALINNKIFYISQSQAREVFLDNDREVYGLASLIDGHLYYFDKIEPGYYLGLEKEKIN